MIDFRIAESQFDYIWWIIRKSDSDYVNLNRIFLTCILCLPHNRSLFLCHWTNSSWPRALSPARGDWRGPVRPAGRPWSWWAPGWWTSVWPEHRGAMRDTGATDIGWSPGGGGCICICPGLSARCWSYSGTRRCTGCSPQPCTASPANQSVYLRSSSLFFTFNNRSFKCIVNWFNRYQFLIKF